MDAPERMSVFREWLGWNRAELGEAIGYSESMVGLLERRQRAISLRSAFLLEELSREHPDFGEPILASDWLEVERDEGAA